MIRATSPWQTHENPLVLFKAPARQPRPFVWHPTNPRAMAHHTKTAREHFVRSCGIQSHLRNLKRILRLLSMLSAMIVNLPTEIHAPAGNASLQKFLPSCLHCDIVGIHHSERTSKHDTRCDEWTITQFGAQSHLFWLVFEKWSSCRKSRPRHYLVDGNAPWTFHKEENVTIGRSWCAQI